MNIKRSQLVTKGYLPIFITGPDDAYVTIIEVQDEYDGITKRDVANAALIAAAPKMLEALEHALADLKHYGGRTLLVESAIAEAKGGKK